MALVLVLLLGAAWGSGPLVHDDLFFHLATGRFVVENHWVPTTDIFSFTRFGERWVSHEWGFGVVTYLIWSAAGYSGLVALQASLVVATLAALFWISLRQSRRSLTEIGPGLVVLLAIGLWAIRDQLILRASLFSSLFILVLMLLLRWFDQHGNRLAGAAIVVLFLGWGNFHGEVLFGLFLLATATLEAMLARYRAPNWPIPGHLLQVDPRRPYLKLFLLTLLATQLNPNGFQVLLYPFRLALFLFRRGSTLEMGHFGGATPTAATGFYLLLAVLLFALLRREHRRQISLTEVLTIGAFLLLSLRSHRFILYFTLFTLPFVAKLLVDRTAVPARLASMLRAGIVATTLIALSTSAVSAWRHRETVPISRHFPAGALRYLEVAGVEPRPFNHQNYGGYLQWNLQTPVYWDGRNLLFASLMEETTASTLEEVTARWQIDTLVLTEHEYEQLREQLDPATWALVQWDDFAALYRLRLGATGVELEGAELFLLPPFGGMSGLDTLARDPAWVKAARRELDRVLRYEPHCQRALYFHGLISLYSGDTRAAERHLRAALAAGPANAFLLEALARVLDSQGRSEAALELRQQAIDLR